MGILQDQLIGNRDPDKLFNSQIQILKGQGCPEQLCMLLGNQKRDVVRKVSGITIGEGNIPFLPVIKPVYLGYYGLMSMVRNGSKEGYIYLNPATITDKFETPNDLYYIYDVENGEHTCGKSPKDAEIIFKKQSRLPLTATEVINLCIITNVLSKRYVWAIGSSCQFDAFKVLDVSINCDDRPELYWSRVIDSYGHWGSPSCGMR